MRIVSPIRLFFTIFSPSTEPVIIPKSAVASAGASLIPSQEHGNSVPPSVEYKTPSKFSTDYFI